MSASPLPRLCDATLSRLPPGVAVPAYRRQTLRTGVVHLGPGAFHRAHQAVVFDTLLGLGDSRWGIAGVSLRNPDVARALAPQDGLYTLAILDETISHRVIGAVRQVLCAGDDEGAAALALLGAADTRLVSCTVTEKGYALAADGTLDFDHPDIRHDLADPGRPRSLVGMLVAGLRRRRAAGLPPWTVVSCDNLADNGAKLGTAVIAYARRLAQMAGADGDLAGWIAGEGAFPRTMVDSITPATDDALRDRVRATLGLEDAWPIQREAFTQWVVEDRFRGERPDLAAAGVILTHDVAAFEQAKLRLLNGPHSALAYLGLLAGCDSVADAMAVPELAGVMRALMAEILPTVPTAGLGGLDLADYAAAIRRRFTNPAIRHRLSQIAMDGSQKLPVRLLPTVADRVAQGAPADHLFLAVAAWIRFVVVETRAGRPLADPLARPLADLAAAATDAAVDVDPFLAFSPVFPPALVASPVVAAGLRAAYAKLVAQPLGA